MEWKLSMWTVYLYWGFNIGFELYEDYIAVDGKEDQKIEYFLINLGCIRIQRGIYAS